MDGYGHHGGSSSTAAAQQRWWWWKMKRIGVRGGWGGESWLECARERPEAEKAISFVTGIGSVLGSDQSSARLYCVSVCVCVPMYVEHWELRMRREKLKQETHTSLLSLYTLLLSARPSTRFTPLVLVRPFSLHALCWLCPSTISSPIEQLAYTFTEDIFFLMYQPHSPLSSFSSSASGSREQRKRSSWPPKLISHPSVWSQHHSSLANQRMRLWQRRYYNDALKTT